MLFNVESRIVEDYDHRAREFWSSI
jgi:hypothetical protein